MLCGDAKRCNRNRLYRRLKITASDNPLQYDEKIMIASTYVVEISDSGGIADPNGDIHPKVTARTVR